MSKNKLLLNRKDVTLNAYSKSIMHILLLMRFSCWTYCQMFRGTSSTVFISKGMIIILEMSMLLGRGQQAYSRFLSMSLHLRLKNSYKWLLLLS